MTFSLFFNLPKNDIQHQTDSRRKTQRYHKYQEVEVKDLSAVCMTSHLFQVVI